MPLIPVDTILRIGERSWLPQRRSRSLAIVIAVAVVSTLHYTTSPSLPMWHEIYQHLYYLPVVVAAYWFGVTGGIFTAAGASIVYLPHIWATSGNDMDHAVSQYADIVMFHVVAVAVGLLASAQRRVVSQHRETSLSLERAHRDLLASQDHVRRSERLSAMGQVAAGLAHEIRNPLAGMKGALDIIASRAASGTPEAEFTGLAATELARLDRLVAEFLSFAKPRDPELRVAPLAPIVDHVLALVQPEAARRGVNLGVPVVDRAVSAEVDEEQITQVLVNVVLNAIQATPSGQRVEVTLATDARWAVIDVGDQGRGIAPDDLARIFEPFFSTRTRGTGLGLAISQRIVLSHQGTIRILDTSPAGTVVRISLPLPTAGQ